ncbi:MAG: hypothetical protein AAF443_05260 [Chlamydiota bacterium]
MSLSIYSNLKKSALSFFNEKVDSKKVNGFKDLIYKNNEEEYIKNKNEVKDKEIIVLDKNSDDYCNITAVATTNKIRNKSLNGQIQYVESNQGTKSNPEICFEEKDDFVVLDKADEYRQHRTFFENALKNASSRLSYTKISHD